jgi:hypothetical protein
MTEQAARLIDVEWDGDQSKRRVPRRRRGEGARPLEAAARRHQLAQRAARQHRGVQHAHRHDRVAKMRFEFELADPSHLERVRQVSESAGYGQVISPLLEDLGVFQRIGDATDVVTKEMYDFVDKGGRHVALRPELTASVCRAFVQHRPLTPWKVWYTGSQFRYEKPQRGRYRQFDQVGIEVLGADDPYLDVEIIALGWEFFRALGLQQGALLLNSLGEPADRARYVDALRPTSRPTSTSSARASK